MSAGVAAGEAWIVAGLLGCAAEMAAPGAFLLPIGLAACGTGAATAWLGLELPVQVVLFLALTAALIGVAWRVRGAGPRTDTVNAPTAGLIGQTCRAMAFEGGEGRVALGDGTWPARSADRSCPEAGALLKVVGLDGTTLLVDARPMHAGQPDDAAIPPRSPGPAPA